MVAEEVVEHSDQESLLSLIPSLCKLSAGTEFSSYKESQWNFLLGGGNDVTAYTISSSSSKDDDGTTATNSDGDVLGCVLRIRLKKVVVVPSNNNNYDSVKEEEEEEDAGFGMMLVSPKARGKGYAKKLLRVAMKEESGESNNDKQRQGRRRNVLAVCSNLGQPVYRKLGYKNVGRIVAITSKLGTVRKESIKKKNDNDNDNNEIVTAMYSYPVDPKIQKLLFDMDKDITGYDRKERLSYLFNSNERTRLIVVRRKRRGSNDTETKTKNNEYDDDDILVIGAVRQECAEGGPLIVGPVIAATATTDDSLVKEATFSIIQTIATKYHNDDDNLKLNMLLNCYYNANSKKNDDETTDTNNKKKDGVSYFIERGFTELFDCPAMAKDDYDDDDDYENNNNVEKLSSLPIYKKSQNYIALIHPTLG